MVPRKVRSHGPKWVMAQASRRAPDGIPKQILGLEFARGRIDVDVLIAKSKLQQYQARGMIIRVLAGEESFRSQFSKSLVGGGRARAGR
jgi:hypothetical protein